MSNRKTQQVMRTRQAHAHKAVTHRSELAELRLRKDADLADLIAKQVEPFIAAEVARQLKRAMIADETLDAVAPQGKIVTP